MTAAARKRSNKDYFICPHCGAEVRKDARACPECGSDEATGWSEDADSAGLPAGYRDDDDFDYEDFLRREFPQARSQRRGLRTGLLIALAILCAALLAYLLSPGL